MQITRRQVADMLFGLQLVCTALFGGSQFVRMLTTAQGVSISWFASWGLFLILNLVLAIHAHRNQPSRVTRQTIVSYTLWVVVVALDLGVMFWKGTGEWNVRDTATALIVVLGACGIVTVAAAKQLPVADPMIKGYLALFCKAAPQFVLAYNVGILGGKGLVGLAILTGHISILTRIGQLIFSIHEAGWDRNRTGSAISEAGNWLSWVAVTIVWFVAA